MIKYTNKLLLAFVFLIVFVQLGLGFLLGSLFKNYPIYSLDNQKIWWFIFIYLGLSIVVIVIIGSKIASKFTGPVESATNVAIELAKGNYRARTYEYNSHEASQLNASLNILARNLQSMAKTQEMQQDRLSTLIENMGSGLILIDSKGYIHLVNRAFKEIFAVKSREFLYHLYYDVIEHDDIVKMIEELFMTETKVRKQVVLPLKTERKHFEIYGAPIIGTNEVWKGIMLVFHDITELKKLEQMRKDFVANVSHELKTPLTSIKGFTETLLDGAMEDGKVLEEFLTIILKESKRLQSLTQDLLDLTKIEQQDFQLNYQFIEVYSLLEEILVILKRKADEKNISIHFEQNATIYLEGDFYRLKQVFINIIDNAINYTPDNGDVYITVEVKDPYVNIVVKDNGIGLEMDQLPRIFERFYRVDRARSRNSGGTGLGLAIVKHLIEAHKGKISIESQLGVGTKFIVSLLKQRSQT